MLSLRRFTTRRGLLAKGLSLLLVAIIAGSVCAQGAAAKKGFGSPSSGVCSLSQNAAGNLVATGAGWANGTNYQYEIYSNSGANVGGGELSSDVSGGFSDDLGPMSFYMSVYPNESSLTFDVYPIVGNKADMSTVLATCSI